MADRTEELGIRLSAEGVIETTSGVRLTGTAFQEMGKQADTAGKQMDGAAAAGTRLVPPVQASGAAMRQATAQANLLAQANRQLPMQVTDIVTSLASGMPVWMVAIQQGGQLRDSYGGILPAGRAVVGLLGPMTVLAGSAAAAVGGLALAYMRAGNEAQAMADAITISGNAAGTTLQQLSTAAAGIAERVGTRSAATDALTAIVSGARVAAPQLQLVGEAVVQMNRNLGISTETAIEMFGRLGREPTAAVAALNDRYNFLTLGVYRQIQALEKQGQVAAAGALAQEAAAQAMISRGEEVEQRVWGIEQAWLGVTDALKKVADASVQVFRPAMLQDRIRDAEIALGYAQRVRGVPIMEMIFGTEEQAQRRLAQVRQDVFRANEILQQNATGKAEDAAKVRAAAEADRQPRGPRPRTQNAIEDAELEMMRRIDRWRELNENALDALDMRDNSPKVDADRAAGLELMQRIRLAIEQQVVALRDETAEMGLNAEALNDLEQARIRDNIARQQALLAALDPERVMEADEIRETIRALEQLAQARQGNFQRREQVAEEADNKRRSDAFAESISQGIVEGYRSGRSLSDIFIRELKAQFAKTVLQPRIAPIAEAGNNLLNQIIGSALNIFTGGSSNSIIPGGVPLPDSLRGGADTGVNYLKRDMVTLLHKGEAVIPEKFNPYAPGNSGAAMGRSVQISFSPQIYIDSRTDQAQVRTLVMQGVQAGQADLLERMNRAEV